MYFLNYITKPYKWLKALLLTQKFQSQHMLGSGELLILQPHSTTIVPEQGT